MKLKLLLFMLVICWNLPSIARDFNYTYNGKTITYTVIDEDAKTVSTKELTQSEAYINRNSIVGVLTLPETVLDEDVQYRLISLGRWSFAYNENMTSVVIPQSVVEIGDDAFYGCGLTSVTLPESIRHLGIGVFNTCTNLKSFDCQAPLIELPMSTFMCCVSLEKVSLPPSLTKICSMAFFKCESLQKFDIPVGIMEVESAVFQYCKNLTEVTFPNTITKIGYGVVFHCPTINTITCLATTPPALDQDAFRASPQIETLYVLDGVMSAYKKSDWGQNYYFSTIAGLSSTLTIEISGNGRVYYDSCQELDDKTILEGADFGFLVIPDDGNRVASILLDGKDVMDEFEHHKLTISDYCGREVLKIEFAPEGEATLTVKGADNHSFTHIYKEGDCASVQLCPEDGWKINSVSYNDEDVTDRLFNNLFVTEPLHGDNTLHMILEKEHGTDIDEVSSEECDVKLNVRGNTVTVAGLENGEIIRVYDVSGRSIYIGSNHEITLRGDNIYLISTTTKTFKVVL